MGANAKKLIALSAAWAFLVTQAVIVPFLKSHNLTITQILLIPALTSFVVIFLDIPTSYLSDKTSKKNILIFASLSRSIGALLFFLAEGFYGFLVSYLFIGIGNSLYSGVNVSAFYDYKEESTDEKVLAMRYFYTKGSIIVAGIAGGLVSSMELQHVALLNVVTASIPVFIVFTLNDPPRAESEKKVSFSMTEVRTDFKALFSHSHTLNLTFLVGIFFGGITHLISLTSQDQLNNLGLSMIFFGLFFSSSQVFGGLVARRITWLVAKVGRGNLYMSLPFLCLAACLLLMGETVVLIFLAMLFIELLRVIMGISMIHTINSKCLPRLRSTANSVVAIGTSLIIFLLASPISAVTKAYGYRIVYTGLIVISLVLMATTCRTLRRQMNLEPAEQDA